MDSDAIIRLILNCKQLKYRFTGVYSADNFPLILQKDSFLITNSENSNEHGKHWLLLCNRDDVYLFADPLGFRLDTYEKINKRLAYAGFGWTEIIQTPIQGPTSKLCGLFCIYIAYYIFSGYYPNIPMIDDQRLLRFVNNL